MANVTNKISQWCRQT